MGSTAERLKGTVFGVVLAMLTLQLGGQLDTECSREVLLKIAGRPSPRIELWQQWEELLLTAPLLLYVNINQSRMASQPDNLYG